MNILHDYIEIILPYMISILEIIGILVVFGSGIYGFILYVYNAFKKTNTNLHEKLAEGLAMGLEFKMAAEILKTVIIQSFDEIYMLGAVILLRALLSLLIHFELGIFKKEKKAHTEKEEDKETTSV